MFALQQAVALLMQAVRRNYEKKAESLDQTKSFQSINSKQAGDGDEKRSPENTLGLHPIEVGSVSRMLLAVGFLQEFSICVTAWRESSAWWLQFVGVDDPE